MLKTGNNVSQGTNVLDTGGELLTWLFHVAY